MGDIETFLVHESFDSSVIKGTSSEKDSPPFIIRKGGRVKLEVQTFIKSIIVMDISACGLGGDEQLVHPRVAFNYYEIGNDIALVDALDTLSQQIFGGPFLEVSSVDYLSLLRGKEEVPVYAVFLASFVSACSRCFNDTSLSKLDAPLLEDLRMKAKSYDSVSPYLASLIGESWKAPFGGGMEDKTVQKVQPSSLVFMPVTTYVTFLSQNIDNVSIHSRIKESISMLQYGVELSKKASKDPGLSENPQQRRKSSKKKRRRKKKPLPSQNLSPTGVVHGSTARSNSASVTSSMSDDSPALVTPPQTHGEALFEVLEDTMSRDSEDSDTVDSGIIVRGVKRSDDLGKRLETTTTNPSPVKAGVEKPTFVEQVSGEGVSKSLLDSEDWETVGSRIRQSRKKITDRSSSSSGRMASQPGSGDAGSSAKKKKSTSKKKNASRKMVREILNEIVDSVGDICEHRKRITRGSVASAVAARPSKNPWGGTHSALLSDSRVTSDPATMRDALVGKILESGQCGPGVPGATSSTLHDARSLQKKSNPRVSPGSRADQSTAPTVLETGSANSNTDKETQSPKQPEAKSDSSSGETADAAEPRQGPRSVSLENESSSNPPLPRLLNPEQPNSSTSSVASSLEVPKRHHASLVDESDHVGYHVVQVCQRLSTDLKQFMKRRAEALKTRRQERGALLAALQDTVSTIWPGRCHVEMYGSCATQLDLPSSDLDVVVLGLDPATDAMLGVPSDLYEKVSKSIFGGTIEGSKRGKGGIQIPPYTKRTHNGNRIMALASHIEEQTWAVQVNALPGAAVPVVKILADPSKLAGGGSKEWLMQQQQFGSEAASTEGISTPPSSTARASLPRSNSLSPDMDEPWRGHDVMNGLLSLDVTFQGPEHGGVGSTDFSARSVQEACAEFNLPPESTPFVQVLMVLKEMLAQRKLNEPYSGGLSSYALLLLVVALQRERALIKDEIEKAEVQRRAVAADSVVDPFSKPLYGKLDTKSTVSRTSSWASIAKKTTVLDRTQKTEEEEKVSQPKPSFADALAKKAPAPSASLAESKCASEKGESSVGDEPGLSSPSFFNQSYNDIVEVLCSGETTAGKLLMHFLLYYGHYFDAQKTSIDLSGKHERKMNGQRSHYGIYSAYIERTQTGTIDPRSGMLIVDPIVIYDPLEGAEGNNVARRCFAWRNVKWTFANAYTTLSKIVEESVAPSKTDADTSNDATADLTDPSSPLLKCLLSF